MSIPYGRQDISEEDIAEVVAVLRSDWLTQGPSIDRFEKAMADYCGAGHAVTVCNATAALHIACLALGFGPGDLLWTSPNTFVASSNCGLYCGGDVDFVDIDPHTGNMSVEALRLKLEKAKQAGRLPKIIIPVHFAGLSCDMRAIAALAKPLGIAIIEDASHAVGGKYRGRPVGSCEYSDITVLSFHPVKIITTGEGGMALTNDSTVHARLSRLRSHGITRDPAAMTGASEGGWYYQQIELGFNYRITDIQAALGASQLKRLDEFVAARNRLADRYDALLSGLPLELPPRSEGTLSAFHLYVVLVEESSGLGRAKTFDALRAAGIMVNVHYIPVPAQPHYRKLGFRSGDFPMAEKRYLRSISLPMYSSLTEADQDAVVGALKRILG